MPRWNDHVVVPPRHERTDQHQDLVGRDGTNRHIAEELYISDRTASVHVSNILRKLEVSNRGEAAATTHRLGLTAM